jgi:hypothetical protein
MHLDLFWPDWFRRNLPCSFAVITTVYQACSGIIVRLTALRRVRCKSRASVGSNNERSLFRLGLHRRKTVSVSLPLPTTVEARNRDS